MRSTTQLANAVMELREALIVDAVNHATGRADWTLEEVKGRGTLTYFGPNECLFMFDGQPLLELYMVLDFEVRGENYVQISHTKYRKLYDGK
jgi:hypothetical protein